jgi:hypothetical protein
VSDPLRMIHEVRNLWSSVGQSARPIIFTFLSFLNEIYLGERQPANLFAVSSLILIYPAGAARPGVPYGDSPARGVICPSLSPAVFRAPPSAERGKINLSEFFTGIAGPSLPFQQFSRSRPVCLRQGVTTRPPDVSVG